MNPIKPATVVNLRKPKESIKAGLVTADTVLEVLGAAWEPSRFQAWLSSRTGRWVLRRATQPPAA